MKNIHPRRIESRHLILNLEWNPFSNAMIPAKVYLIYIDLFGDQNSFQTVAADQRAYEQRPNILNENRCVIGVLSYF